MIGRLLRHLLHWQGTTARLMSHGLTLIAVLVAWIFFRAESLDQAAALVVRLVGVGAGSPFAVDLATIADAAPLPLGGPRTVIVLVAVFAATLALPNTQQLIGDANVESTGILARRRLRPNVVTALLLGGAFALALLAMPSTSVFIYFRF
ncbi:MAG: hypothetical protein EXQ99_08550 [Alphaproteobacteria bacterium]|nr:hypothetical protein [Alphaproteobacteria bacterium]